MNNNIYIKFQSRHIKWFWGIAELNYDYSKIRWIRSGYDGRNIHTEGWKDSKLKTELVGKTNWCISHDYYILTKQEAFMELL